MYFYSTSFSMKTSTKTTEVAILVIMEDVFLLLFTILQEFFEESRNPCYNGRCISTTDLTVFRFSVSTSRNPCYNGRCISTYF